MRLAQAWPGHLRGTGISHRPRPACDQILRRGHRPGPARAAPGPSLSRTSVSKISWDVWRSRRRFWRPPSEDFGGLRFEFLKSEIWGSGAHSAVRKRCLLHWADQAESPSAPDFGLKLVQKSVEIWSNFGPKIDPILVPKCVQYWTQNHPNFGTKIGPFLDPKSIQFWYQKWV